MNGSGMSVLHTGQATAVVREIRQKTREEWKNLPSFVSVCNGFVRFVWGKTIIFIFVLIEEKKKMKKTKVKNYFSFEIVLILVKFYQMLF